MSSGLGVQGMLWATSPACTELETHVLDWLADLLALPNQFKSTSSGGGVIQDSASSAALCALLAARERTTQSIANQSGADGQLVAYTSNQAHSSIEKAIMIAGIGRDNLRLINVDDQCAMRTDQLAQQIEQDLQEGKQPFFVSATLGTTSSNGIDSVADIGPICAKHRLWLHVDAAMAGTAAICPEFRAMHEGMEHVDSYCFNPHKWLFTNFDCDAFFVADRQALINALSIVPEFLRNQASDSGQVIDYRDWQIPLGRRFRALKLWFVLRHYGIEGLQYHIRRHIELTRLLYDWIAADDHFEIMAPAPFNLICFRHKRGDKFNQQLLQKLNQSGTLYMTHTVLNDHYTLRFCVGQSQTELHHIEQAWQRIQTLANELEQQ